MNRFLPLALVVVLASVARADHLQPGDVAPATRDASTNPATVTPTGDGAVNIQDVVLVLRAAVGLDRIVTAANDPVTQLQARLDAAEARLRELEALLDGVSRQGDVIVIDGANVRLTNGMGSTDTANGLGNLILGYDEPRGFLADRRSGSHNLVLGMRNNFTSWSGVVLGESNEIVAPFASVLGGASNSASGFMSVVSGGEGNAADASHAVVSGGFGNLAGASHAVVSGGRGNEAAAPGSAVAGGAGNAATGDDACVLGGIGNEARGEGSTVAGGLGRVATGESDAALGALSQDQ